MKITNVEFKKSIWLKKEELFVDNKKEIVFVGRSNVGKSSLLNSLLWKKNLAYVSAKPGKTQTANLFLVNKKYFFTDLPWYGYARGGKERSKELDELVTWYILEKKPFIGVVIMLVDSIIWPQPLDVEMYNFLKNESIPVMIALTKVDKLSNNEKAKSEKFAEQSFFWEKIVSISSTKNMWIENLKKNMDLFL